MLDLGLPDLDGTEVIAGIRGWTSVPIIVLLARTDSSDKVEALDAGADDYVTKPFGMDELLARLHAAHRRSTHTANDGEAAMLPLGECDQCERQRSITSLKRAIADVKTRNSRLIRTLGVADAIDQDLIRDINERRTELHARRDALEHQLAAAETAVDQAPNPDLIDHLPVAAIDLAALPDALSRRVFEALWLQASYDTTHAPRPAASPCSLAPSRPRPAPATTPQSHPRQHAHTNRKVPR